MKNRDLRSERKLHREEENKTSILDAAEKIFAQKGYSLTSVDDIAEEAQFSKATIYRYFVSKKELFMDIVFRAIDEAYVQISQIKDKQLSAEEKLRELVTYIVDYYHTKRSISRSFITDNPFMKKALKAQVGASFSHPPIPQDLPQELISKMREINKMMVRVIKEGIKKGEFRNVNAEDAEFVLSAMMRGFYFRGPFYEKEYSSEKITELLVNYFFYGIKKK